MLAGIPSKPSLYVVMAKWLAVNHFSRPHFDPHDRFFAPQRNGGFLAVLPD